MPRSAPDCSIRVARAEDLAVVVRLLEELVVELTPPESAMQVCARLEGDISSALASSRVRIFLAEHRGDPIGLSRADLLTEDPVFRLRVDNRCGYVDQMFVRTAFRGAGIGQQLLARCEDWFRELGVGYCLLHAAPRAVGFYEHLGYQTNREMFKRL